MHSRDCVLVIDDEPMIRRAFGRMLSSWCHVVCVASAEEALEMLDEGAVFDAIVCDLKLGRGLSGREFYGQLLARFGTQASRMIVASAAPPSGDDKMFGRVLANRWLVKPIDFCALRELVSRVTLRFARAG